MLDLRSNYKLNLLLIALIITLWIILTEYIFPINNIFPSPTLVYLSFYDLILKYNFFINILSSLTAVYGSMIICFIILKIKFPFLLVDSKPLKIILQMPSLFKFIPGIVLAVLLIYWFDKLFVIKILYAIIITSTILFNKILLTDKSKYSPYIDSVKSLGVSEFNINRKILWKFLEPDIINEYKNRNLYLWSSVIVFEFIDNYEGIGFILRRALAYNDLSMIISLSIITAFVIFLGDKLIYLLKNKFYFWN